VNYLRFRQGLLRLHSKRVCGYKVVAYAYEPIPADYTININRVLVLGGTGTTIDEPPRQSTGVDATRNANNGRGGGGIPDRT